MSTSKSPTSSAVALAYNELVRRKEWLPDAAQLATVQRLDALLSCVNAIPAKTGLSGWMRGLGTKRSAPLCRGIYLWGGVGRGKTRLMDLFAAHCQTQAPQNQSPVKRTHFAHLMRDVQRRLTRLRQRENPLEALAVQMAKEARVLCLDEFQVQDIGDAMILHGLMTALFQQGVVLVTTSNTPPAKLYEGGLQRDRFLPAIRLLQKQLDIIELTAGPDYRLQQLTNAGTWLSNLDAGSPAKLQKLFLTLSGLSQLPAAAELAIEGRKLPTLHAGPGVAWFTFDQLCRTARSASDYIALARGLHTLFLTDVPILESTDDDAARRLIALVDEVYDRHVNLVVSAAAEPMALYRGERLRSVFERTASRLLEMRSQVYLSQAHRSAPLRMAST